MCETGCYNITNCTVNSTCWVGLLIDTIVLIVSQLTSCVRIVAIARRKVELSNDEIVAAINRYAPNLSAELVFRL